MNLKQIWANIVGWWNPPLTVLTIPKPDPEPPLIPAVEVFQITALEPDVFIPSLLIDLEFIEPPAAEEPQPSELSRTMDQFLALLAAQELRALRHDSATGSCNEHVPSVDSRAAGAPVDSRAAGSSVNSRKNPNP